MSKCKLQKGDVSILIEEKLLDSKGNSWVDDWTVNCDLEVGTVLRIPYEPQDIKKTQETPPPVAEIREKPREPAREESVREIKEQGSGRSSGSKKQDEIQKIEPILTEVVEKPVEEEASVTEEKNEEQIEGDTSMAKKEQELIATVQQPTPDAVSSELMKLAKDNASDPTVTIILAALAVFGGGAAMKFYRQWSEQKHEEKMAKIKIESKGQDKSPGQCQAVHAQLTAEVAEVKSRIGTLENQVSVNADFDGERLEKRVKKLEKWRKESDEE